MALAELRGHWKTAVFAYIFYYIMLMLPAAVLDFIFGGATAAISDPFAVFGGSGNSDIYNSLFGADAASITGRQGRSLISALYVLIISGPLLLGFSGFILSTARGARPGLGMILDGFNNFFRALGSYLMIMLRVFLWCLPFIIVISLMAVATLPLFINGYGVAGAIMALPAIIVCGVIVIVVMMVFVVRVVLTYAQTFFLLIDEPRGGVLATLRQSRNMMFGNKKKLLHLNLSFIGWFVLVYVVLYFIIYALGYAPSAVTMFALPVFSGVIQAPLFAYLSVAQSIFYDILSGRRRLLPANGGTFTNTEGANDTWRAAAGENSIATDEHRAADIAGYENDGGAGNLYENAGENNDFRGHDGEDRGSRYSDGEDM
jgi:uncharacterized membrane protein